MTTPGDRLRSKRRERDLSAKELADRSALVLGRPVSESAVRNQENGTNGIPKDAAEAYGRILKVTPSWILFGGDDVPRDQVETVPLVGYVGAGAQAHFYGSGDSLDYVPAPEGSNANTRAAEIRGESLGPLFERWLIFYDDVRTPVTPDLIGKLCIVGLPDDRVLVKKLQRSKGAQGLYHLLSNTEAPILDQDVLWAALVRQMTPR